MDLRLRVVAVHPRAASAAGGSANHANSANHSNQTEFALSSRRPSLLLAHGSLLIEQTTSTLGVRAALRTSAPVEKLVYCGGSSVFLAFLEDLTVAAYRERDGCAGGVELVGTHRAVGDSGRSCAMACGSRNQGFAVFNKTDSPNIHAVFVGGGGTELSVVKLHAGIAGAQENVSAVDKGMSKLRGRVATKAKAKTSTVVAIAAHPNKPLAAAAYENGMLRVWDLAKKELRSNFDGQLLLREGIVDIDFHPELDLLVACTSQGRIISFPIRGVAAGKSEEPQLAAYKLRDRNRRYRAMCFREGSPTVLLLLTASRRVLVRLVNDRGQVMSSSRFAKASRPLSLEGEDGSGIASGGAPVPAMLDSHERINFACEPMFGLIALSMGISPGNVYVYEQWVDGVSGVRRPIVASPIDTGFSTVSGKAFKGPVNVHSEGVFLHNGRLFVYSLRTKLLVEVCRLPASSEVRYMEVARDQYGSVLAAMVFLYADRESDENGLYDVEECLTQYVIVTRGADGEAWNVSEPLDGESGCFLNSSGQHDRYLVLSLDGKVASVRSFEGRKLTSKEQKDNQRQRPARGVQNFRVGDTKMSRVFRSPFSSWCAVVYEDRSRKRLVVSKNAFRMTPAVGEAGSFGGDGDDTYGVDEESGMSLERGERVLDIRWQRLPTARRADEQYLGAILTTKRVYVVRDVFELIVKFDFDSIHRSVVPFTVPTMCWMGPSIAIMFGQFLYTVALDGTSDLLSGMSQGDNACALAAVIPDSIVYIRPSSDRSLPVSIVSRPIGMMSVLVRGMLALPSARNNQGSYYIDKLKNILLHHDASQGSEALIEALIRNDLSPIAYILATSEVGQHTLPPLKRAGFLGLIGDLRGSLAVAEAEYSRLPSADMFHDGTELYRLLQRILNMAMASGDFAVGQRCSELLGRKGTFSAFVDSEGGYAAITALSNYARKSGNPAMADRLAPLVERSSKSCIATDTSGLPSISQLRNTRAGIESYDKTAVSLGTEDKAEIFVIHPPEEGKDGTFLRPESKPLAPLETSHFIDRLEVLHRDDYVALKSALDGGDNLDGMVGGGNIGIEEQFMGGNRGLPNSLLAGVPPDVEAAGLGLGGIAPLEDPLPPLPAPDFQSAAAAHAEELQLEVSDGAARAHRMAAHGRMELVEGGAQSRALLAMGAAESSLAIRGDTGTRPDQIAMEGLMAAFEKMSRSRYPAALREVRRSLKTLGRAKNEDNMPVQPGQVAELAYYLVALELLVALEDVANSQRLQAMPQKLVAEAQYATALAELPLRDEHRFSALLRTVDANLRIDNYGFAAQALQALREVGLRVGIAPELRDELRTKYNLCESRGGMNRVPALNNRFCCHTLRLITPGVVELKCTFCPCFFSEPALVEQGVRINKLCPSCHIGNLVRR